MSRFARAALVVLTGCLVAPAPVRAVHTAGEYVVEPGTFEPRANRSMPIMGASGSP